MRRREANIYCLESEDLIHGCSEDEDDVQDVLASLEVQGQPSEVCVVDGDGEQVECFSSRAQAETFLASVQVGPKPSPVAERLGEPEPECLAVRIGVAVGRPLARRERLLPAEADGREHPVLRHAGEGAGREGRARGRGDRALVLHRAGGARTVADAFSVRIGVTERVRIGIPVGLRVSVAVTRRPSPISTSPRRKRRRASSRSREAADDALAAIEIVHEVERFCVVSSAGEQLGCSVRRDKALDLQRQSGQERLLRVIGETARLEERAVLEIVPASDPRPITCGTEEERELPRCSHDALEGEEVVYPGPSPVGQGVAKFVLGPTVISGEDFNSATAVIDPIRRVRGP